MRVERGVTRNVLVGRRWVVKVPAARTEGRGLVGLVWSVAHGILANLSERDWSALPGVCPVRWSLTGLVNVYPRADPPPPGDIAYAEIAPPTLAYDPKPANVGVLGGRLVWIDYDQSAGECVACLRVGPRHRETGR